MTTKPYHDADTLRELYWNEGMSLHTIGDKYSVAGSVILYHMKKHGINRRKPNREKPPHFTQADSEGYERIVTNYDGVQRVVLLHRLVAVAEHGFETVAGNIVHHKNNVPWDNRPSNLEPITKGEHSRRHRKPANMRKQKE